MYCWVFKDETEEDLVVMRRGGTPVPIPNTTVKTATAESTMLETAWEGRWLPDHSKKSLDRVFENRTDMLQWVERKAKPVLKSVLT